MTNNENTTDANEYLERWYPKNGTCLRENELLINGKTINNFDLRRDEITNLYFSGYDCYEEKENTHWIKLKGILDLSDFINLEQLDCSYNNLTSLILPQNDKLIFLICNNNKLNSLEINHFYNLSRLECQNNLLLSLIIDKCDKLKSILCYNNNLKEIFLSANNQLERVIFYNNQLIDFPYHLLNSNNLIELSIWNNNIKKTNISVFSDLINLEFLSIGNNDDLIKKGLVNRFFGSLESLKDMTKLNCLNVLNTNADTGLEYLPSNLEDFKYKNFKLSWRLKAHGHNISLWKAYHPELMKKAKKELVELENYKLEIEKVILDNNLSISTEKMLKKEPIIKLNYDKQFNYSNFLVNDIHPFSWELNVLENKVSGEDNLEVNLQKQLPLRLYNLSTNQVIKSEELPDNTKYLTLSYCWGTDWEKTPQSYGQPYLTDLTKLGRKALNKVKATYKFLKQQNSNLPDYIWIDNFCINQVDTVEKNREVASQRNYYSNAAATFIAIDAELGYLKWIFFPGFFIEDFIINLLTFCSFNKIIQSPWFHRVWTFQEGLLSKNTIFMFDDALVDGRRLALTWGGIKGIYNYNPFTFVTPFGWSYTNDYQQNINLTLGEVLFAVSCRKQTVLVDKVYSILGLLPYGDKVKVEYKSYGQTYTQRELEEKLLELIEQAYLYDSKEIITYLGDRNLKNWWLPIINEVGSFQIKWSLSGDEKVDQYYLSQIQKVTKKGIQLRGHLTIKDGIKIVEIDKDDSKNKTKWDLTIQFELPEINQPISIKKVKDTNYSEKNQPEELFINMINREVIIKSDNQFLYYKQISSIETDLSMDNQNLKDSLDFSELIDLEELNLNNEKLTNLILPNSEKLKDINCRDNQLTKIKINSIPNLEFLGIRNNNLTELDISNNLKLTWLNCSVNKLINLDLSNNLELEYLYSNYNSLINLNISKNIKLKKLILDNNKLNAIDLTNLVELKMISINNNYLDSFNYSILNPNTLTLLNISDNNLPTTDIAIFSHLINLEALWFGCEDKEMIQKNFYNRFCGSLSSWKDLTKLRTISISNTDIDAGLEHLPLSIEEMYYSTKERPNCQLKIIEQQLKNQTLPKESYSPNNWKNYWNRLIKSKQLEQTVEQISFIEQFN